MNKNIAEIIDALTAHEDTSSIQVLEELGTNSPDNEIREYTSRALVKKNLHDSLKVVIINQGKGINDLSPAVAMSTINEILSLKEAKEKAKVSGGEPYVLIEEQLRTGICIGMEMVDLKWLYKGKTYHSTAIVSNEHGGFVYEHIGYRVIDAEEGSFQEDDYSEMNSLRTKTSSEGDGSDPNPGGGSDIILRFTKMNSVKNAAGMVVATYNITVRSVFNSAGILIDRNLNATHSAAYGFTCTADVRTVSGTLYSSKYHEFAWGYSYGSGISVSLGWNGSGFTISGGGQGATGIEIHRP